MARPPGKRITPPLEPPSGCCFIPLARGEFCLVDEDDYDNVSKYNWHSSKGYAVSKTLGARAYMHRLVIGATGEQRVDHINGNPRDNRKSNLRICTQAENTLNKRVRKDSRSGLKGVHFHAQTGKWRARIKINGKEISLGLYFTPEEAARAYDEAAPMVHGEFARKNSW